MKLQLRVDFLDGKQATVETSLWVITQWERKFKSKISSLANGVGAEDLAFMAFEACRLANIETPLVFDDFIKRIDKVEVVESDNPKAIHEEPNAGD
jgi:hypothetical protein